MPHARTTGCAFAVVTLISLGVVLDVPASVPQLPVLAARSLMSARPRCKERWNQDRPLLEFAVIRASTSSLNGMAVRRP